MLIGTTDYIYFLSLPQCLHSDVALQHISHIFYNLHISHIFHIAHIFHILHNLHIFKSSNLQITKFSNYHCSTPIISLALRPVKEPPELYQ